MKKYLWAWALLLCAVLCLSACGTDDGQTEGTIQPSQPAAEATVPVKEGLTLVFDGEGSGWSQDHTVYTSRDHTLVLQLRGLEPDAVYRAVLMGLDLSGDPFAASGFQTCVTQSGEGTGTYTFRDVTFSDGVHKELTLAVVGNGEIITHRFTYEQTGGAASDAVSSLLSSPEVTPATWFVCPEDGARMETAWADWDQGKAPGNAGTIIAPTVDAVYVGGRDSQIPLCIYSEEETIISVRLENVDTGEVVLKEAYWGFFPGVDMAGISLPETWTPGNYRMTVTQNEQTATSVKFVLQEDPDLSGLLEPVCGEAEQRLAGKQPEDVHRYDVTALTDGQFLEVQKPQSGVWISNIDGEWSPDRTVLTSSGFGIRVEVEGMQPGVPYYAAVLGRDITGETFCEFLNMERYDDYYGSCYMFRQLVSMPGTYRDVTVAVIGGEETFTRTFDYVYASEDWDGESVYGPLMSGEESKDGLLVYTEGVNFYEDASGTGIISYPRKDVSCYGHADTSKLPFLVDPQNVQEGSYVLGLIHKESDQVVSTIRRTAQQLREGNGGFWEMGNCFALSYRGLDGAYSLVVQRDGVTVETVDFNIEWDLSVDSRMMGLVPEKVVPRERISQISLIGELKTFEAAMTTVETDAFEGFLRYKYKLQPGTPINSFAICSPNVKVTEASVDVEDYLHTANWTLRDLYEFEQRDRRHYTDVPLLDLPAVNAVHGLGWTDLKELEYLRAMEVAEDGSVYVWTPVYYDDGQGGILNDQLYLFAYILYPGADEEYIRDLSYFSPEFYHEYHITRMLITDQATVAKLLGMLRGDGSFGTSGESGNVYPRIVENSYYGINDATDWYVEKLQNRLRQLGFLTQEITRENGMEAAMKVTMEAVRAFQRSQGLPEDGIADHALQQLLYSGNEQKELVIAWLDAFEGRE